MPLGLCSNISKTSEGYPQYRTKTSCTFAAGDSDKVEVANHADLQVNSSDFSFSGWVKFTVDASGVDNEDGYCVMQAGTYGSAGNGNGRGFYLFYYDAAHLPSLVLSNTLPNLPLILSPIPPSKPPANPLATPPTTPLIPADF